MPSLNKRRVTSSTPAHFDSIPTTFIEILVKIKINGKSDSSINSMRKLLMLLDKHANLKDPKADKHFIATHQVSSGTKRNLVLAYDKYAKHNGIEWEKPRYQDAAKPIRIPTKTRNKKHKDERKGANAVCNASIF